MSIYRGILTGYNEAFIIDEAKRKELIEKSPNSAELIRPLLRGRDIKKWKADFAGLYLIATFPSLKIDIEKYPAVKNHLLSFGKDRLEQSGKTGARKKTNHQWFETQDPINYWDDFSKEKIMWKIIGSNLNFVLDTDQLFCNNAINIMIGKTAYLEQFLGLMNSKLFNWYFKAVIFAEVQGGGIQMFGTVFENVLIKLDFNNTFNEIVRKRIKGIITDTELNEFVFKLFNLDKQEINFINSYNSSSSSIEEEEIEFSK